ncbi:MAG: YSC84-related protein [Desulfobacterales bacterium]|jgi:lipid-binding SYLF domain-containing protein
MKSTFFIARRHFPKVLGTALFSMLLLAFFLSVPSYGKSGREIDTSVDVAMERFYRQVDGAREFAKNAKGLLVLPNVKKAAFIIGGEYGEGALRIDGKTVDYYNIVSGSFGLQIGAQGKDIIIAFMTGEALTAFRGSQGWEAGVDGNIALIDVGAGGRVDTTTMRDPIVGFVFDVKGLMADVSLKGAKITKLNKAK